MSTFGQPNIVIIFSNMKHVAMSVVQSLTGANSHHRVKYSMAVILHFFPILHVGVDGTDRIDFPFVERFKHYDQSKWNFIPYARIPNSLANVTTLLIFISIFKY